ncbi:hypothetical protein PUNSTDRAFT_128916 [Punctularia strigosozonata HHB-11173 SS5]|uniref:uncharacterized protein n=1 Tax=Punctularia strigosozonata (strain HHB-11173) TaxID=741275 RepID=UPI000441850D|nr:uncharacterized protein PUNSTDRAFT_128916 [Punctularia strigosozonata HHB-11173 SS5]EIN13229.1 hypothetical protein PUNSTDRAFT_128916 [Punctularia strigosozonata HHB-11173 SS5]
MADLENRTASALSETSDSSSAEVELIVPRSPSPDDTSGAGSTVHDLPFDIIKEIFTHVVKEDAEEVIAIPDSDVQAHVLAYETLPAGPEPRLSRCLASVCGRWRRYAYDVPFLWSRITFSNFVGHPTSGALALPSAYFGRSVGYPLHIEFVHDKHRTSMSCAEAAVDLIMDNIHRCRTLTVVLRSTSVPYFVNRISLERPPAPLLQHFRFSCPEHTDALDGLPALFADNSPCLKALHLGVLGNSSIHYRGESFLPQQISAHNLAYIRHVSLSQWAPAVSTQWALLPGVKHLTLSYDASVRVAHAMNVLWVPDVTSLVLDLSKGKDHPDYTEVIQHWTMPGTHQSELLSRITHLTIKRGLACSASAVNRLYSSMTSLQLLYLDGWLPETFIQKLMRPNLPAGPHCPQLRSFAIRDLRTTSLRDLKKLVEARREVGFPLWHLDALLHNFAYTNEADEEADDEACLWLNQNLHWFRLRQWKFAWEG